MSNDDDDCYMRDPKSKTIAGLIEGLLIFAAYEPEGEAARFVINGASHDIVYFPDAPAPDTSAGKRLTELGWHWASEADCWGFFT